MKQSMFLPYLLTFFSISLQAQSAERDVLANAGGITITPGYIITWTLGETFVATRENITAEIIITEGFQQPESGVVPTIDLPGQIGQKVTIFPNPAGNIVNISLSEMPANLLHIRLTDANGRILHQEYLSVQTTSLDLHGLPAAWYFIFVQDENGWINAGKFVKQ